MLNEVIHDDYEATSLQGMIASFKRCLKREKYQASIINNFSIGEKSQDPVVQARKAQKQSKSNKQKGSRSLKEKQIRAPYNKDLLEKSCPEALLNSLAKQ